MHWNRSEEFVDTPVSDSHSQLERSGVPSEAMLFEPTDVLLLVDDNRDMLSYIKSIFAPFCKVVEATSGEEALTMAKTNPPDLILSDMMMPKLNGQDLLVAIRNDPATRLVPVILLCATSDEDLRLSALTAGAEDFILKPFKSRELLVRVQLHMQVGKRLISVETLHAQREKEIALLSDHCPSGIMRADAEGNLLYCNAAWRMFAGMGAEEDPRTWPQRVDDETLNVVTSNWEKILHGDQRESQMSWKWLTGKSVSGTFIRLDKVDPAMSGILGCLSDISYQEERTREAERRRVEAEESKRQQELLVDVTSHEIRTAVSAILHCSSLVKDNLVALNEQIRIGTAGFEPNEQLVQQIEEGIEASESMLRQKVSLTSGIYQCGLVQERIANDLLSFGRVQRDMLTFNDVEMDPRKEARKVGSR